MATKKELTSLIRGREINPKLKIGDNVLIVNASSGYEDLIGKEGQIERENTSSSIVRFQGLGNYEIGKNSSLTEWVLIDRKMKAEIKKKELSVIEKNFEKTLSNHNKKVEDLKEEIKHLQEFESDEEFVAHKLSAILTAHGENTTEKARVSAIADVLKELKTSNLL